MTSVAQDYPGKRLGLPESGPGSMGRLGRRVGALCIDYGAAYLISGFFGWDPLAILGIFALIQIAFLRRCRAAPVTGSSG